MAAKPLTAAEKKWLKELQDVMDKCPSKRMGFYATGGSSSVHVFDFPAVEAWESENVSAYDKQCGNGSYPLAVESAGAVLGEIVFPAYVQCVE